MRYWWINLNVLDATMYINNNDLKDKSCSLVISKVTHTIMKGST